MATATFPFEETNENEGKTDGSCMGSVKTTTIGWLVPTPVEFGAGLSEMMEGGVVSGVSLP
jgi:hypothetical protein